MPDIEATIDTVFADKVADGELWVGALVTLRGTLAENNKKVDVMRLKQQDKPYVLSITSRWIKALATETIAGRLWIVDDQRIRIRE